MFRNVSTPNTQYDLNSADDKKWCPMWKQFGAVTNTMCKHNDNYFEICLHNTSDLGCAVLQLWTKQIVIAKINVIDTMFLGNNVID